MHKGLACWFDQTIKHRTKIIYYKFGHILSMICYVIFHHPRKHSAKSAFIVKSIWSSLGNEICISTFLLNLIQFWIYFFIVLNPVMWLEKSNYFVHHCDAVCILRRGLQFRMRNFHLVIESACVIEHLHESWENFGRISFLEVIFDCVYILIEVFENMETWDEGNESKAGKDL